MPIRSTARRHGSVVSDCELQLTSGSIIPVASGHRCISNKQPAVECCPRCLYKVDVLDCNITCKDEVELPTLYI